MKHIPNNEKELYLIANIVNENVNGRKIVLWGDNAQLRKVLKKYFGLDVAFVITILKNIVNEKNIYHLEYMDGKSSEYYIVAWGRNYEEKYNKLLNSFGYNEIKDFVYRRIKPIIVENWDCSKGKYEDAFGNIIDGKSGIIKKVTFNGYNNRILLDNKVWGTENLQFEMYANSEVTIREGSGFGGLTKFKIYGFDGSSRIYIDRRCHFLSSEFVMYNHTAESGIFIDEDCTFGTNLSLHANAGKKIVIGRDCMFSYDVQMQAGDGHTIFDVITGENINSLYRQEDTTKNMLVLGEHVWVSARTFILNGTNVGNGSIIGGNSTVKGIFANNCVVAGNPAKTVKENIAWSRDNCAIDIKKCGKKEYVNLTNSSTAALNGKHVLVVGGTRFMGIRLVRELLARGNHVTIATRGKTKDNFGSRIERIILDIADYESVKRELSGRYFDVVFDNLAYCSNYVKNLLSVVKCRRYVQLSSVEVYTPTRMNIEEKDFDPNILEQKWCDASVGYQEGKRQAEAAVYQKFSDLSAVTVRVPYVTKTDRLLYYCRNIVLGIPMNIDDINRCLTFVREAEVGKYLVWIASQKYRGPINFSSTGYVTIKQILEYIERKTGRKAIIDTEKGEDSPFHVFNEKSFSMDISKSQKMGYVTSDLEEWFWNLMDEYIQDALDEEKKKEVSNLENKNLRIKTIEKVEKDKCTGCGACMNICPKKAITMIVDQEGFLMPYIEKNKCVNCGLCEKNCPAIGEKSNLKNGVSCYAMMANDDVRMISSSGGAFTLLAEKVLEKNGVVFGAAWDENYNVKHIMVDNKEDLWRLRGSKYVQSNTVWSYQETKTLLESGRNVLYTGMPCQIDGLMHYLQRDYDNLITVDLLCRGIASNDLFKKFINDNYKNQKIEKISFKDKKPLGWGATTSYQMSDGHIEKTNIHNSIWMCAYLANIMDRNSCYSCRFNTDKRIGDISIGDFWGINSWNKNYNDTKGTSIIITSSQKGDKLVRSIKQNCKLLEKVPLKVGIPHNSALCSHVKRTPKRELFFKSVRNMPIPAAVDRTIYGEKYHVGIVGWWYNLNYGGTMTYFALNKAIQKLGYSVLMIRRSSSSPQMPNDNTVPMRFAKKYYNISRLYTTREMHWINYSCHAFISGSDQLWNPYLEEFSGPEFFLSFVNEHNLKISYASSFGNIEHVPSEFKEKYKPYLDRFNAISVREDYAVEICKSDFGIQALHLCDPIFLCDKEEFIKIADTSKIELPEKYLLNFLLDPSSEKVSAYRYVKEQKHIGSNINFTDLQNVKERMNGFEGEKVYGNAEIEDFIKAYINAEFVVTDSFHGTCLAIIFNKPFISIANKKRGEKRFISLLNWLGLTNRLVYNLDEIYNRPELFSEIDFRNVNKIISESKEQGMSWLKSELEKMV